MENFQLRLMYRYAKKMLYDADILQRRFDKKSDSAYLIKLLSLELLLKCLLRINFDKVNFVHHYREFFRALPEDVQQAILTIAQDRMSTSADYSNLDMLLDTWSKNFIQLRYPYELYEGLSEEQYDELGLRWAEKGWKNEDAKFVYYPDELRGIIFALEQIIEAKLKNGE